MSILNIRFSAAQSGEVILQVCERDEDFYSRSASAKWRNASVTDLLEVSNLLRTLYAPPAPPTYITTTSCES